MKINIAEQGPIESKGAKLKAAREAQGLSLDVVHEVTKVPMDVLRAIEEGYNIRTLTPFYYKGFLKIYAQYLNFDIEDIVEDYHTERLPERINGNVDNLDVGEKFSQLTTKETKQKIVIIVGIVFVIFLIVVGIRFFLQKESPSKGIKSARVFSQKKIKPVRRIKSVKKITKPTVKKQTKKIKVKKIVSLPKVKVKSKKVVQNIVKKKVVPVEPPQLKVLPVVVPRVENVPEVPVAVVTKPVQKNVILSVRAKKPSWLRVKSDGMVVFQTTLREGSVETWLADDYIEISGKNIGQLEFELNGEMMGSLSRRDRKARKIIVTVDGLSTMK